MGKFTSAVGSMVMAFSLSAVTPTAVAAAHDFPNRPITLFVPWGAGGSGDVMVRYIADKLSGLWGQSVIVEQKTGANGLIGINALKKSRPDGYTALALSVGATIQNLVLKNDPGYSLDDFAPASLICASPVVLAVGKGVPANNVKELMALAAKNPGQLSYGTNGVGSVPHTLGAALNGAAGTSMTAIAYKGEAQSFSDLVSGRLTAHFGSLGFYAPHQATGDVKLLAVTNQTRMERYPDIPTLTEAGYPGANITGFMGIVLPAGTDPNIVQKFSEGIQTVLNMSDVREKIMDVGFDPTSSTVQEFETLFETERSRWQKVITDNNIRVE